MHKVKRNKPPESLLNKQKNIVIKEYNPEDWKLSSKERGDLIEALDKMYKGCCAYCESSLNIESSPRIDHFRPRKLFPELTFEYNNLNYSCEKCNGNKKELWDDDFFSPSEEDPEEHIRFEGIIACKLDFRGQKMIDALKLNDSRRLKLKEKTYEQMLDNIVFTKQTLNRVNRKNIDSIEYAIMKINETLNYYNRLIKEGSDYCTMVKHNFREVIEDLKDKLKELKNYEI